MAERKDWPYVDPQTHCYTCGKELGDIRYKCPVCEELCCSEECRDKHLATMEEI